MRYRAKFIKFVVCVLSFSAIHCGSQTQKISTPASPLGSSCAPSSLLSQSGASGAAFAFLPDPMASADSVSVSPTSTQLDTYRAPVSLNHLDGSGILRGLYVHVVNGLMCNWDFGAFSSSNQFTYSHSDSRFQEVMSYYFGDIYRSEIDKIGYLQERGPVYVVAHCDNNDNASFSRGTTKSGQVIEEVCLGDSVRTPGAYYSDDGVVTIHELQHATTVDNYSILEDLNQLYYDEAGALNEAISDFMGISFLDAFMPAPSSFDPRIFSRWALGTFDPSVSHARGAHRCPTYDSHYPSCDRYPLFEPPTSANGNSTSVSYVYPDGQGWPFTVSDVSANVLSRVYDNTSYQEEIHNAGIVLLGTLWDLYDAIKKNHQGKGEFSYRAVAQLVLESVRHLPQPNLITNHSPVTFIGFASKMVSTASQISDLNEADRSSIEQVLTSRGLYGFRSIELTSWAGVGPGVNSYGLDGMASGIYIKDDPEVLKKWLANLKKDPSLVTQEFSSGFMNRLDPGEVAAIWFDIQNNSNLTAGGVLVTVTSNDPDLIILDEEVNRGYLSQSGMNQAQVMYGKINGTDIVSKLNLRTSLSPVSIGNTYFRSDPLFSESSRTAIWIKVSPTAPHGKIASLSVTAAPSNGVASSTHFSVMIQ